MRHASSHQSLRATGLGLFAAILALTTVVEALQAQRTRPASAAAGARTQARTKGVWEPVSYPADIHFNGVFFVTPDLGWATSGRHGQGGMLLRTTDAGANWEVQLGDYQSQEPVFHSLYFLDAKRGWALQDAGPLKYKLLRTSDGDSWEQAGGFELQWGLRGYAFLSKNVGVLVNGNDNVAQILRTTDGGRTWREVYRCRTQLEVQGLRRDIQCSLNALHFPTPKVGYALGVRGGTLMVAKTVDGGVTWRLTNHDLGIESGGYDAEDVFFTDENTGIARLPGNRIQRTTDGGVTWTGAIGTPGPVVRFADPEVGWSLFESRTLSYTTNGGKSWLSRKLPFPAAVTAFSVPRRDRAFVVGEHGMAFRYRVVAASEPAAPKAIDAPAMPTLESELDDHVEELEEELETLEQAIAQAAERAAAPASGASNAANADTIPFVDACCAKRANELQATADALVPLLSRFSVKYRNVNLIIAGLQLLGIMPDQLADVRTKLQTLRRARGATAAATALAGVTAALDSLRRTTRYAFQQEPPVISGDLETGLPAVPAGAPASTPDAPVPDDGGAASRSRPAASGGDQAADDAARKTAEDVKRRAREEARKRVRIRLP